MATTLGRRASFILNLWVSLFLLWSILPVAATALAAVGASPTTFAGPDNGVSLRAFSATFTDARLMSALFESLLVAAAVTALSLPLGLAGALVVRDLPVRAAATLLLLLVAPMLLPGAVVGLSTRLLWQSLGVEGGRGPAILAETSLVAGFVAIAVLLRLASLDRRLEEAARDLGAGPTRVLRRILLPHLAPVAAPIAATSFLAGLADHDATLAAGGRTLLVEIGRHLRTGPTPLADATVVLVVAVTALLVLVVTRMRRRGPAPREIAPRS